MGRPAQKFEDLPRKWRTWLARISAADNAWRRARDSRRETMDRLVEQTGRAESTVRNMPEYADAWQLEETLRIERAELFAAAVKNGVTMYRVAKHLGYQTQRPVTAAIESLKGERVDYRRTA